MRQFDLQSSSIPASEIIVATYDGFEDASSKTTFIYPKLAPDNKIYLTSHTTYFHTIDFPDLPGLSCHVSQHAFQVPAVCTYLPNTPNYQLGVSSDTCIFLNASNVVPSTNCKLLMNPSNGILNLRLEVNGHLLLYDLFGHKVFENDLSEGANEIDLSFIAKGLYVAEFLTLRNLERLEIILQ
ncbi:MAG: hypothetical protein IPP51_00100 [Bacteroidetes bacterium]|nr:hypothetical protein [Bacteroidota bacterium]